MTTHQDLETEADHKAHIYVKNAGLVLLSPFLERFFSELNLLNNQAFVNRESAERAALLLQYLATYSTDTPEDQLALCKVMCGLALKGTIPHSIDVSTEEKELADSLLLAVISHWSALGSTSAEGLQSSFLEREGRLGETDGNLLLEVEQRGYDVLLDRLPWSLQFTKLPWMEKELRVAWR